MHGNHGLLLPSQPWSNRAAGARGYRLFMVLDTLWFSWWEKFYSTTWTKPTDCLGWLNSHCWWSTWQWGRVRTHRPCHGNMCKQLLGSLWIIERAVFLVFPLPTVPLQRSVQNQAAAMGCSVRLHCSLLLFLLLWFSLAAGATCFQDTDKESSPLKELGWAEKSITKGPNQPFGSIHWGA